MENKQTQNVIDNECINPQINPDWQKITLTQADAVEQVTKWVNIATCILENQLTLPFVRGFHIKIQDLQVLTGLKIDGYTLDGARIYLGIENTSPNPINPLTNSNLKVILVPTFTDNSSGISGDFLCNQGNPNYSTIFDFTRPCPPECDVTGNSLVIDQPTPAACATIFPPPPSK